MLNNSFIAFIGYGVQRSLYTIPGKTSYILVRLTKHVFSILYTILGKPATVESGYQVIRRTLLFSAHSLLGAYCLLTV